MLPTFRLFGGPALFAPDGTLVTGGAAQPRRLAVLAVLAEAWPAPVTRDRLVGLIWPDHDAAGARRLLTQALYALRRELGDVTGAGPGDLALDTGALQVDLIDFRRAASAGDLEGAAACYRGPALDGFYIRGAPEFERWCDALRDDMRHTFSAVALGLLERHTAGGRPREAATWGERLVREAPYDASVAARSVDLWLRAGDHGAALAAVAGYERRMRTELEVEPDPSVRERVRELARPATPAETRETRPLPRPPVVAPDDSPARAEDVAPGAYVAPVAHGGRPRRGTRRTLVRLATVAAVATTVGVGIRWTAWGAAPSIGATTAALPAGTVDSRTLAAFHGVAPLRQFVAGELALRHDDPEAAYQSFRAATELDSTVAYAWYRRAIAAETAHHMADADRSIAMAAHAGRRGTPRDHELVRGYAAWRRGDTPAAESIYRGLLAAESRDAEAWFRLAELAYHSGPLFGRRVSSARDAWDRVVALDSGNVPALVHAIRLKAHAGDTTAVAALLRRATRAGASDAALAESRVIAAYASGVPTQVAAVQGIIDRLPDYSLQYVHAMLAGALEQPDAARAVARRMVAPSRPDAIRGEGHQALAYLALAQGRWREASAELDRAARFDAVGAASARAYFATLPFVELPAEARARARAELEATTGATPAAPLYLQLSADAAGGALVRHYSMALLAASGAPAPGLACIAPVTASEMVRDLCQDLRLGLAAEAARRAGDDRAALRLLEGLNLRVPYQYAARSQLFARSRERFIRAQLLERTGRDAEAYEWYASATQVAWMDYVYLAPSHLGRARIRERQGDRAAAAVHYQRALALLGDADPALDPLRAEAERGWRRASAPAGS